MNIFLYNNLYTVFYVFFSVCCSLTFISLSLFPVSLSFLLSLPLMLQAISPERRCIVSQLQAERFITAICSFYHSPSLPLSICPSLCLTQAFTIIHAATFTCLHTSSSVTCMSRSCSIVSVLLVMPSLLRLFISELPSALAPRFK